MRRTWSTQYYVEVFTLPLESYLYLCPYFGTRSIPVQLKLIKNINLTPVCLCVKPGILLVHTGEEAREGPVDPASDDDHGQHVGEVPLHHVRHHRRVRHRVPHGRLPLLRVREVTAVLIVEEILPHQIRLWKTKQSVYSVYSEVVTSSLCVQKGQNIRVRSHLVKTMCLLHDFSVVMCEQ